MEYGIHYEVAESLLGSLIALCSDKIREEQDKDDPNQAVITEWRRRHNNYIERRRTLYEVNGPSLADLIKVCGEEIRTFSQDYANP